MGFLWLIFNEISEFLLVWLVFKIFGSCVQLSNP